MSNPPDFDLQIAHHYFAAQCFNLAWELIEKAERTPEEDEAMIRLSQASHYHWTQREDYSPTSRSIANWQLARIYAVLGRLDSARHYAELCLQTSQEAGVSAVFVGYAYEALARVAKLAGDRKQAQEYLAAAQEQAEKTEEAEERRMLLDDLADLNMG